MAAGLFPSAGAGPPLRFPAKVGKSSLDVKSSGLPTGAALFPFALGLPLGAGAGASSYYRGVGGGEKARERIGQKRGDEKRHVER